MIFTERDYQVHAHDAIFHEFEARKSTLLVIATGLGKTIIAAHVIKSIQPKRVLVLAHRDELIIQAKDKIQAVTGLPVEVEKADQVASTNLFHRMPVVVSSIQTQISGPLGKRQRFKKLEGSHRVVSKESRPQGARADGHCGSRRQAGARPDV